jgi:hypothetical protein
MTAPTQFYAPRDPDFIDTIGYTQRVVDQILRNNPLTDAVVSEGLIKWIGNYTNAGNPDKINFVWIGEFFPADTNLPGSPPQRGISMVRDDSRGGISAFAIYDDNPGGGGGLKQTIHMTSGDNDALAMEHRDGGWRWPEENIYMGPFGSNVLDWIGTTGTTYPNGMLYEGWANILGNRIEYRVVGATTNGATADFRMRLAGVGGDVVGPTHSLGVNSSAFFINGFDVSASRGTNRQLVLEAQRTNGVGEARATVLTARCYTP